MSTHAGVGPDGRVYCKHMEEAAKHKSNTPKHPNREFYCCKKYQGDPNRCKFWIWADELFPVHAPDSSAQSAPKQGPIASTSNARPPQKHSSQSNTPSDTMTPRSKKRLEDIAAGLKQRDDDLSPARRPGPSKGPVLDTPSSLVPTIPQPPSPVPTEVDLDDTEEQPRENYSFLGLCHSPEPVVSVIKDEGQPSTPKKRRLISAQTAHAVPSGDGLLLTPPQTRHVTMPDQSESPSAVMRGKKGKEREGTLVVQTQDQGLNSREAQEEDSLPLFTLPEDASTVSSVSPTIAENVLDYTDGVKARVKALSEYMASFDITQAVQLLQTMERQKIQYEYRDRNQKMRIEGLVAERDKLAVEVLQLKEKLHRYGGER